MDMDKARRAKRDEIVQALRKAGLILKTLLFRRSRHHHLQDLGFHTPTQVRA